jgi:hypothetical protein
MRKTCVKLGRVSVIPTAVPPGSAGVVGSREGTLLTESDEIEDQPFLHIDRVVQPVKKDGEQVGGDHPG